MNATKPSRTSSSESELPCRGRSRATTAYLRPDPMKESAQTKQHNGQADDNAEHGDGPEHYVQDQTYHQGQDPSSAPARSDGLYEQDSGEEADNDLGQVIRRDPEN